MGRAGGGTVKRPIATNVVMDETFGPSCAKCLRHGGLALVTLEKIEAGPRIGIRETYRHVEAHPICLEVPR
jgi:hypothetical protein